MSSTTSHYGFTKPAESEAYSVGVQNENLDKADAAIWSSLVFHRVLTSSDDMNSVISEGTGIFYIGSTLPLNAPPDCTWSIVIQIKIQNTFVHQYLFKPVSKLLLIREYSGSPTVFGDWQYIAGYTAPVQISYGSNSKVRYWKSGQTGFVTVLYNVSDGSINAWSTKEIATLPAGFRPAEAFTQIAAVDRSSDAGTCISIDSNGKVKISTRYNAFNETGDVLQFACSFPIRY